MVFITAEIGTHWEGDFELLDWIVSHCSEIGFDAVKFQALSVEKISNHPELDYYEEASVNPSNIHQIDLICKKYEMEWYCTPTYADAVEFLDPYVNMYKISVAGSNNSIKDAVFSTGKKVIISTEKPFKHSDSRIKNLYCIPRYPTSFGEINFDLMKRFDGFSCHTPSFRAVLRAMEQNIEYLEIHVTPSKSKFYIDNPVSFSIAECYDLVRYARAFESGNHNSGKTQLAEISK